VNTHTAPRQYEDEIDLLRYGRFLARYAVLLIACAAAGAALGLFASSRGQTRYQASATLAVIPPIGATAVALNPATSRTLLTNLTLISQTIDELGLQEYGLTPQSFVDDALEIVPVPATNLVRLSVSLPDPTKARRAADLLARKAADLSRRLDQDNAKAAGAALKTQLGDAAARFDTAQKRLIEFKTAHHVDMLTSETDASLESRRSPEALAADIAAEKARLSVYEQELQRQPATLGAPRAPGTDALMLSARESPPAPVGGARSGADGEARRAAEQRASGGPPPVDTSNPFANPVYGALQYEVARSRARVSSLERQLSETRGSTDKTRRQLDELYLRKTELARLEADYDINKKVYSDLTTKYEEILSRIAGDVPQLQIIDAPVQPDRPLPRRRIQFALLGMLLATFAGLVAALLINRRSLPLT
jgi:uncharacterized protein involved in exopolysaccharide biosynthesis